MTTLSRSSAAPSSAAGRASSEHAPAPRRRDPVLLAGGVGAFVVTIAVLLVPHASLPDDPTAAQVTAFFSQHYTVQQSQTVMHSLGAVAMLVFFARLASVVRRFERPDESSSRLVLAAAAALTSVAVVTMGFVSAAVHLTGDIDGSLQESLYFMGWDFHFKVAYLVPLVLLPACHVLRRERAAARTVTWSGLGLGGLALLSTLGNLSRDTMFVQYPVFMLFLLWVLVAGLVLGLRGTPDAVPAQA